MLQAVTRVAGTCAGLELCSISGKQRVVQTVRTAAWYEVSSKK
jgi:hypothetical protein